MEIYGTSIFNILFDVSSLEYVYARVKAMSDHMDWCRVRAALAETTTWPGQLSSHEELLTRFRQKLWKNIKYAHCTVLLLKKRYGCPEGK